MLKGKNIVLGVTGSIAAYKIASLASMLKKLHANVDVIMTKNACNFINPITFETLTSNKCIVDTFDRNFMYNVEHVSIAKKADMVLIAPASANVIAKLAHGICDDMLTTTILACKCPIYISPAMNTNMYTNPILQDNLAILKKYGYHIINPKEGYLACGDVGSGKMPEVEELFEYVLEGIYKTNTLEGKNVLITAGATREALDPVRYITNHSTGKMGYALAKWAYLKGANVTLISGITNLEAFHGIKKIDVTSALDMYNSVVDNYKDNDIIIMSAAVADYTPLNYSDSKIKKSDNDLSLELKRTNDILKYVGQNKLDNQIIVGFSMETNDLIENSTKKLKSKNVDMICANSINNNNTGFGVDTNLVTLITSNGVKELPFGTKEEIAGLILDEICKLK
ncbi:MAG: bifunctional phosphopantothenoylcysteine decarboxylase/phosphopantothenate--cysteine ligase CoaBC [Anaeroplasmataceae bacterium]